METQTAERQKKACRSFEALNEGHCDFGNEVEMKNGTIVQRTEIRSQRWVPAVGSAFV